MSGKELTAAQDAFDQAVNRYVSKLNGSMSEFERELFLHDQLAKAVSYKLTENAHNAYGALVEGNAVCDGYAEALQYLLQRSGIQSFMAIGSSVNPSSGLREGHAWNYVRIDGAYYHADLTWNDQGNDTFHAYFNLTDKAILEDHSIDSVEYKLPTCSSSSAMYFNVKEGKVSNSSYSADQIAKWLKNNGLKASIYATDDLNKLIKSVRDDISEIGEKAGVRGRFTYTYSSLGRELLLHIEPNCDHTSLQLISAVNPNCTESGNIRYYTCVCGKWFSDSSAKKEITDKNSVVLERLGHHYAEKIENKAHLKKEAVDCQSYHEYWYDCTRCSANAKDDWLAVDCYYISSTAGNHHFTEKVEDEAHRVSDSGKDCLTVFRYYYDCTGCTRIGSEIWISEQYGDHQLSEEWITENGVHFHQCMVNGCKYKENEAACSGGTATCTHPAICSTCQQEYGEYAEHQYNDAWESDLTHHWKVCDICNENSGKEEHKSNTDWRSDMIMHWKECHCGVKTEVSSHIDDDQNDECDLCAYSLSDETQDDPENNTDNNDPPEQEGQPDDPINGDANDDNDHEDDDEDDDEDEDMDEENSNFLWVILLTVGGVLIVGVIIIVLKSKRLI